VSPNQLWWIILPDRPGVVDLSPVGPLSRGWFLVIEQGNKEVAYGG
jgi:hypothetical protein